jgi:hypothetical protein
LLAKESKPFPVGIQKKMFAAHTARDLSGKINSS